MRVLTCYSRLIIVTFIHVYCHSDKAILYFTPHISKTCISDHNALNENSIIY